MRRCALAMSAPANHASTTVCRMPNARIAITRPAIVRRLRSRCRKMFLKTSRRNMSAGNELALVEVRHVPRRLHGVRVVAHHDDGLPHLGVEPAEQRQHLL